MKLGAFPVAVLIAFAAGPASVQACTFDQKGVASELERIARRNPGYRALPGESAVEWKTPTYKVRLSLGGCEDLGAEVRVVRTSASVPLTTEQLIAAVARYRSADRASAVRAALASGKLVRSVDGTTTYLEASEFASPAFPLGFTIEQGPDEIALSWQEL
ncbi:hypothetical protein [Pseudoxanthomonas composti]|uniref:Uncharacterized protein n=1 Tax=Pseudoxanthomonas composti TaxID=2137479 RepID=A0A4Q1JTH9_9GAMM|nr:hypothetical protein [Pseudoxanthomonas composti]RXR04283.1 hypothetical protein EPA99_12430 [Pseudoxanthomonas composti]